MPDRPPAVIEISVAPSSEADRDRLIAALRVLAVEDELLSRKIDMDSGAAVLGGNSEEYLAVIVDRMKREFKVEANVGQPQVAYREAITKKAEINYQHKKQTGGTGQYAKVSLTFEPLPPGGGFEFENDVVGGSVPKEYVPGVEKGIISVRDSGLLAGFPIIDFKVTLTDGAYHDVDSSVLAFEIAARAAFREIKPKLGMKLLEPIMRVEVVTPEDYYGDVVGDLNSRRGQIQASETRGNATVLNAMVPLANMFGYVSTLRSMTQGRAQYTMFFDHYEAVPQAVADEVIAKLT
jgi:elongation factor G